MTKTRVLNPTNETGRTELVRKDRQGGQSRFSKERQGGQGWFGKERPRVGRAGLVNRDKADRAG